MLITGPTTPPPAPRQRRRRTWQQRRNRRGSASDLLVTGISANGATRWIAVGPVSFQPSELAKLGLLLVLAGILGSGQPEWRRATLAVVAAAVPILLTVVQPDLSTATLLAVLAGSMLVIGRVPLRFLMPLVAAAAVSAPLLIGLLRPYQVERLG